MWGVGCVIERRHTLPSMTATQELVVPKSIPMTSLPVAKRDALELHHENNGVSRDHEVIGCNFLRRHRRPHAQNIPKIA